MHAGRVCYDYCQKHENRTWRAQKRAKHMFERFTCHRQYELHAIVKLIQEYETRYRLKDDALKK